MIALSKVLQKLAPEAFNILPSKIAKGDYCRLDLSIYNTDLNFEMLQSSNLLENYIWSFMKFKKAQVAYGGYLEPRGIYQRSIHFNQQNPDTERNIHLGLDLWIAAETPIVTPLDAEVHSFKNNLNYGDYGPTIILKHEVEETIFYTLYGHLSLASIASLKVGQCFKKGTPIATLGDAKVNGDYPPHLHFQIIKDIGAFQGDYPGVSNKNDLAYFAQNCPDPNLLLNIF